MPKSKNDTSNFNLSNFQDITTKCTFTEKHSLTNIKFLEELKTSSVNIHNSPCLLEYDLNTLLKGGGLGKWLTGWKRSANLVSKSIDALFSVLLLLSPLIDECLGGGGGAALLLLLLLTVLCWGIWNIVKFFELLIVVVGYGRYFVYFVEVNISSVPPTFLVLWHWPNLLFELVLILALTPNLFPPLNFLIFHLVLELFPSTFDANNSNK